MIEPSIEGGSVMADIYLLFCYVNHDSILRYF